MCLAPFRAGFRHGLSIASFLPVPEPRENITDFTVCDSFSVCRPCHFRHGSIRYIGIYKSTYMGLCSRSVNNIFSPILLSLIAADLTFSTNNSGLPFSSFLAHINPHYKAPFRAVFLNFIVSVLLSLINIGSTTAFNALLSLATLALYCSYLLPIAVFVSRRFSKSNPIVFGPWSMGKFGLAVNLVASAFCIFLIIFLPFPPVLPVTAVNMNWAAPVFIAVMLFAVADWVVRGKGRFVGPIRETGSEASSEVGTQGVLDEKN